jgi:cobalt-zinc-cadmium efflux system outer membrane protein
VADLLDDLLIPVRKKLARERVEQAERRVAHDVLALAAEVKTAFYAVQAHQQIVARFTAIADVNDATADLAQRQFDAGNINRLDFAHQQIAAQSAKLEVTRTSSHLRGEREKLNRLLGLTSSQTSWKIAAELPKLPAQEPALENLEGLATSQRLDLAAARANVEVASRALSLKRNTRFLPASLGLGVDTERETDGSRVTGPTLEIGVPIFDQGQAELAQLASELRRATDLYEGLASDVASEVREAREELVAARATTEFYQKTLLPQRTLILRETLLHYNAMQKSNYELLAAKEQQLTAERESVEALRDYWTALAHLERAVGGKLAGERAVTALPRGILAEGVAMEPMHHSSP